MSYHIPEEVLFQDINGEAVLLNVATGIYFGLDEVGTRIWTLLGEHGALEPVVAAMLAEYEVSEEKLRADLDDFVAQLVEKGLLISK